MQKVVHKANEIDFGPWSHRISIFIQKIRPYNIWSFRLRFYLPKYPIRGYLSGHGLLPQHSKTNGHQFNKLNEKAASVRNQTSSHYS